jgi:hypothetical protein
LRFGDCCSNVPKSVTLATAIEVRGTTTAPKNAPAFDGAPRPMKMDTIASPWRYEAASGFVPIAKAATPCDFALRRLTADFAGSSVCPSIGHHD